MENQLPFPDPNNKYQSTELPFASAPTKPLWLEYLSEDQPYYHTLWTACSDCWMSNPDDRPSMHDIAQSLNNSPRKFHCSECAETFINKPFVQKHMEIHDPSRVIVFACLHPSCDLVFSSKEAAYLHFSETDHSKAHDTDHLSFADANPISQNKRRRHSLGSDDLDGLIPSATNKPRKILKTDKISPPLA